MVDGASRALGVRAAAKELGVVVDDMVISMATDSSGAKSFASRRGTGRIRHIEVKWLWLQQAVADGRFRMQKVLRKKNPADMLTKFKTLRDYSEQLSRINLEVVSGKAGFVAEPADAPELLQMEAIVSKGAAQRALAEGSTPVPVLWGGSRRLNWADATEEECGESTIPSVPFCRSEACHRPGVTTSICCYRGSSDRVVGKR